MIKEVDQGLHPSRLEVLLRLAKQIGEKRKIDIVVTTQNPSLLEVLEPQRIPFVIVAHRDSDTGESKLTMLESIEYFPKLFASALLGKLTSNGGIERNIFS